MAVEDTVTVTLSSVALINCLLSITLRQKLRLCLMLYLVKKGLVKGLCLVLFFGHSSKILPSSATGYLTKKVVMGDTVTVTLLSVALNKCLPSSVVVSKGYTFT